MTVELPAPGDGGEATVCRFLEQVIGLVDEGELDASPSERAYLAGVLQGLRSMQGMEPTPRT